MKARILLLMLFLTAQMGWSQQIATKNYPVRNYSSISARNALDVILIPDGTEGVSVKCDNRLLPAIAIEKRGHLLDIGFDWDIIDKICKRSFFGRNNRNIQIGKNSVKINGTKFNGGIKIIVHVNQLYSIRTIASGNISWKGDLITDKMELNTSSSGDISWKGTLKADYLVINCSSSGDVEGDCNSKKVKLKLSSSGDFKGNITSQSVVAKLSSSGDYKGHIQADVAQFELSSSADAKVSGRIKYLRVNASSSADFHGKQISFEKADVRTSSMGNIYLSKSGKIIDHSNSGLHID